MFSVDIEGNRYRTYDIIVYMAKSIEKLTAIKLRKSGHSIRNIAKQLSVSRSSVSLWCENIILTQKQMSLLHKNMVLGGYSGRMAGVSSNKEKRRLLVSKANKEAENSIGTLSKRDISMISLGLYWGEGSKNTERKFVFTNSDVDSIKCIVRWLLMLKIKKDDIVASVYINGEHKDRVEKVEFFWAKQLGFNKSQFRKTVLVHVPMKKIYENRETYFGVLRLTVKRSTYLKALIMGELSNIKKQV